MPTRWVKYQNFNCRPLLYYRLDGGNLPNFNKRPLLFFKSGLSSSGHTKYVDFAHFYWFGQFLLISGCTRQNLLISAAHGRGRPQEAKNVDFISIFLHQINKNRLEINNFGGAHGKNLDLRVHTVGAHGRGRLKSIDLAVCTLKSIKMSKINNFGVTRWKGPWWWFSANSS